MGAFGELMIKTMGGDLRAYRGDKSYSRQPVKSKKQLEIDAKRKIQEELEHEEEKFKMITSSCENVRDKLAQCINNLEDNGAVLELFKDEKLMNRFISWRDKFLADTKQVFKQQ